MKRIILTAALLLGALGLKAQDCDAIMLPYFGYSKAQLENYKSEAPEKFDYRCAYARAAFYESDTIPAGVDVFSITEVVDPQSGKPLPKSFKVDLNVMGYYSYTFSLFHGRYKDGNHAVCFSTPSSAHPYLVMRSLTEMRLIADSYFNAKK